VDGPSDDSRPRKRINRGPSSDPIDLTLSSPEVSRPAQRRRVVSSSDDSELPSNAPSSSLRRIVNPPDSSTDDEEKRVYTRFRLSNPQYPPDMIDAAWKEARRNEEAALRLLQSPNWKPKAPEPISPAKAIRSASFTTGRVKEVEEAHKAQRAAAKEKSKKSSIYANRLALDIKNQRTATPPPKSQPKIKTPIEPDSPVSPVVTVRRRIKRVVDSESEAEGSGGDDSRRSTPVPVEPTEYEARALQFFNTSKLEELQELTGKRSHVTSTKQLNELAWISGVTEEQAAKIIAARPFEQPEDINAKLSQTKKKAGSTGISPRIFEDTVNIMEGYADVDRILEKCEHIGTKLKAAIAAWTVPSSDKGKGVASREGSISLADDVQEDGALSLRSRASVNADRKNLFFGQPSLLSDSVTLKEYQLLGVNWLNLLYNRKLSCILADEMGKTPPP
jgi:SWI/SNF-related matrix-associated actin-dependent regulator 1 of chromatin subfamily A